MNIKTKKAVKIIIITLVALICGVLFFCGLLLLENTVEPTKSDLIVSSMGEFATEEHHSYGWLQDGGTYSKYTYKSAALHNEYLSSVTESNIKDIKLKVSDFEFWVTSSRNSENEADKSLYENYDFDVSIIDTNDYWFIEYDEADSRDFEMFIFDIETKVLYGFNYSI